jgi:hypothetical protein
MQHRQCNECFHYDYKQDRCKSQSPCLKCSGFDPINICYSEFSKRKKEITGKV